VPAHFVNTKRLIRSGRDAGPYDFFCNADFAKGQHLCQLPYFFKDPRLVLPFLTMELDTGTLAHICIP
jgi:hypothetical protein